MFAILFVLIAQTNTADISFKTGIPELDAVLGKLAMIFGALSIIWGIVVKIKESGLAKTVAMIAESFEAAANDDIVIGLMREFPNLTHAEATRHAKGLQSYMVERLKLRSKEAGTERFLKPIVKEVQAKIEEKRKTQERAALKPEEGTESPK